MDLPDETKNLAKIFQDSVKEPHTHLVIKANSLYGQYNNNLVSYAILLLNKSTFQKLLDYINFCRSISYKDILFSRHSITSGPDPDGWYDYNGNVDELLQDSNINFLNINIIQDEATEKIRGIDLNITPEGVYWSGYEKYSSTIVETELLSTDSIKEILDML